MKVALFFIVYGFALGHDLHDFSDEVQMVSSSSST
jgi:hypothetical protein